MKRPGLCLLGALAACARTSSAPRAKSFGTRLVEGAGQQLIAAPAGGAAAYLREPSHPQGPLMPADAFLGQLELVGADGQGRSLGAGATNLAGSVLFSADGRWLAYLTHFDFPSHTGDLSLVAVAGGEPKPLAAKATFFGFSPDGRRLAYVANGGLVLQDLGSGKGTPIASGVESFEFSADGHAMLYRKKSAEGADLVLAALDGGRSVTVARRAADYQFDRKGEAVAYTLEPPDGLPELHLWRQGADRLVGKSSPSFAFSSDGKLLAFVAGVTATYPEGDINVVLVNGGQPERLGRHAGDYVFSPDGSTLAFFHDFYNVSRTGKVATGKLSVWRPGRGAVDLANLVLLFSWSHKGDYLAWVQMVTRPLLTEELHVAPASALTEGRVVGGAIHSFEFTQDDRDLLFRTGCIAGGNICDLMKVPTDAARAARPRTADGGFLPEKAVRVAAGLADYDFSPDGRWIWIGFASPTGHTIDLAVIPNGPWTLPHYVDHGVEPHPAWLPTGKLAYLVNLPKRAGFYEADPAAVPATPLR